MTIDWPPPYTLRRSKRARNISLQIDPAKGLELVLPYRANLDDALRFLEARRSWVEKHADVIRQTIVDPERRLDLPSSITLNALEKSWDLRYHFLPSAKTISLRHINDRLIFTGNITDFKSCSPLIKKWVKQLAKEILPEWLQKVSHEVGLPYKGVSIKGQKTLWGSCSPEHNISLNYKLLFLPFEMVRYVLIHELSHTVHLNHSKHFWGLVRQLDPKYKQSEKGLKNVAEFIPRWLI